MTDPVHLEIAHGLAEIVFDRPASLNAVNPELAAGFEAAVRAAVATPSVRAILLRGEGRSFMAGGDLASMRPREGRADAIRSLIEPLHRTLLAMSVAPVVTLAAAQGPVAGAGMSLALGTDLAIAAEGATFSMAYARLGVTPDTGGSWSLARLVGVRRALDLALLGGTLTASDALGMGLVNRVVPDDALVAEARSLGRRLAAGPAAAQALTKTLVLAAATSPLPSHLDAERDAFLDCAETADFDEGLAAFFDRRTPSFRSI